MDSILYENYLNILKQELVPALGCTEPIAIAYTAAKARQILGEFPDSVEMELSGNIIKNVKGVTVPNSGGMKGVEAAVILGIVGGKADRELEVLQSISEEDRRFIADFYKYSFVGLMLDWIKHGMKENYEEIVHNICITMHGTIANSIHNFTKQGE